MERERDYASVTEEESQPVRPRTYIRVWVALIILTGLTVSAAGMDLGPLGIPVAMAIAGCKSGLVLSYFMHLRYERSLFLKLLVPGTLILLLSFIITVFSDLIFR